MELQPLSEDDRTRVEIAKAILTGEIDGQVGAIKVGLADHDAPVLLLVQIVQEGEKVAVHPLLLLLDDALTAKIQVPDMFMVL